MSVLQRREDHLQLKWAFWVPSNAKLPLVAGDVFTISQQQRVFEYWKVYS